MDIWFLAHSSSHVGHGILSCGDHKPDTLSQLG